MWLWGGDEGSLDDKDRRFRLRTKEKWRKKIGVRGREKGTFRN